MRTYQTAASRWAGVGPYYAMFPSEFADRVITRYTEPGDAVLDPFAGRGTAVFSAAHQGRYGYGIEINPVGWVYANTKLQPATRGCVEGRLRELGQISADYSDAAAELPTFFRHAFAPRVRAFLLAARDHLDWRNSRIDCTTAALLLVYLHGKREASLSNQMRQTKAMAPGYAVRWWRARGMRPPRVDPVEFMVKRLDWRYARGLPVVAGGKVYLADSSTLLPRLSDKIRGRRGARAKLLLTSPPYFATTNYHYDQWLRLWLLGGPESARRAPGATELRGKFENAKRYEKLLREVFEASACLLGPRGVVYVRTGADDTTWDITERVLRDVFVTRRLRRMQRPYTKPTQTMLFGDKGSKPGEVDVVLLPR